jgi:apolipoprotein N-acyltransferase
MKWGKEMAAIITARYCSLTARERDADLVVWPETALPFVFEDASWARQMVEQASSQLKGYLLLGAFSREDDRFYNATFMLRHGRVTGLYRKVHLVPFGEYTPFLRYLPFREWVKRHVAELSSGEGHNPLKMLSGNVGVLICYEGIFPAISRKTVKNGAQILINVTNDAWYDRSSAPYQHMAFYVFRAVETDRFVLRAANTGISAIIDPRGRLIQRSRIFEETAVRGRFSFRSTETFYVRYGEWFLLLCLFYLLIILLVHARHLR